MTERSVRFARQFLRDYKALRKRYPHLDDDFTPLVNQLRQGETPGDQLQGMDAIVFKVRLPNRDAQRGKSGGYRVIYFLPREDGTVFIAIYSKSDQDDISAEALARRIDEVETESDKP